jgi:hypothetical protein
VEHTLDLKRWDKTEFREHHPSLRPKFFSYVWTPDTHLGTRPVIHPEILYTNKQAYSEGIAILYSENMLTFWNKEFWTLDGDDYVPSRFFPSFFQQIGSRASLIRRFYFGFRVWDGESPGLGPDYAEGLKALRDNCPNLTTLELGLGDESLEPEHEYIDRYGADEDDHTEWIENHVSLETERFDLMDGYFKSMPSLREVIVHFSMDPDVDPLPRVLGNVQKYGWTIEIDRVWHCAGEDEDGEPGYWYDNERKFFDDCNHYCEEGHPCRERRRAASPAR